jgi:hypothetical protein
MTGYRIRRYSARESEQRLRNFLALRAERLLFDRDCALEESFGFSLPILRLMRRRIDIPPCSDHRGHLYRGRTRARRGDAAAGQGVPRRGS